ncbi:MAG: hypothetical protein ACOCTN_02795 [Candidatus Natronoplasma sp.]
MKVENIELYPVEIEDVEEFKIATDYGKTQVQRVFKLYGGRGEGNDDIRYADLDGHLLLPDCLNKGLTFENGILWTLDELGIGVKVMMDKLERYM